MPSYVVPLNAGQVHSLDGLLYLEVPRALRLHLRTRPGDTLWLVDPSWPVWVQGMLVINTIEPVPHGIAIYGLPSKCRWFPHARIGIMGAFTYKQTLHFPPGKRFQAHSALRMSTQLEEGWTALLAGAPQDRPSCYCGQCQQFKDPAKFRRGGHNMCKACYSKICYEWYGKVRRQLLRESTDHPLSNDDWADCQAFFDHTCAYCGGGANDLTRDHVVSVWRDGGEHSRHNVVPACRSCNSKKSDREMQQWYTTMPFFSAQRLERIQAWLLNTSCS